LQVDQNTADQCRSQRNSRRTFTIKEPDSEDEYLLLRVGGKSVHPIVVELTIKGLKTQIELDTGAAVSIISTQTKNKLFPQEHSIESSLILTTYSDEQLKVTGQMLVDVKYGKQQRQLPHYVIKGNGPSLMGMYWLQKIKLNWKKS